MELEGIKEYECSHNILSYATKHRGKGSEKNMYSHQPPNQSEKCGNKLGQLQ